MWRSHMLVDQEVRIAHILDRDAAKHLPNDDFDVLVVDLHTLESVDLLDFVHQVLSECLLTHNSQNVVRIG